MARTTTSQQAAANIAEALKRIANAQRILARVKGVRS